MNANWGETGDADKSAELCLRARRKVNEDLGGEDEDKKLPDVGDKNPPEVGDNLLNNDLVRPQLPLLCFNGRGGGAFFLPSFSFLSFLSFSLNGAPNDNDKVDETAAPARSSNDGGEGGGSGKNIVLSYRVAMDVLDSPALGVLGIAK